MRCVIARFPFELTKGGVLESMKGIKPEPVTGQSVIIGRRHYPVKQVGQVITRQDRRDFSAAEVLRAMAQLGFTCRAVPKAAPLGVLSPMQHASAMLGAPVTV
ncbi:SCO5918 family protein [Streptomyces qaidamensis]|uniref:SCO5918 family protein n=1 Tax=Streptomyces qaidamensis TaxID=1783515 RepID=UPI0036608651